MGKTQGQDGKNLILYFTSDVYSVRGATKQTALIKLRGSDAIHCQIFRLTNNFSKQIIGCLVLVIEFAGDACKQKSRSEAVPQLGLQVYDISIYLLYMSFCLKAIQIHNVSWDMKKLRLKDFATLCQVTSSHCNGPFLDVKSKAEKKHIGRECGLCHGLRRRERHTEYRTLGSGLIHKKGAHPQWSDNIPKTCRGPFAKIYPHKDDPRVRLGDDAQGGTKPMIAWSALATKPHKSELVCTYGW